MESRVLNREKLKALLPKKQKVLLNLCISS